MRKRCPMGYICVANPPILPQQLAAQQTFINSRVVSLIMAQHKLSSEADYI